MSLRTASVPRRSSRRVGPGEVAVDYQPGDFLLTHARSWTSTLIRFGERLRFWGADRKYAWWSHAAMIVSDRGDLIEALGAGVERSHISKYRYTEFHLVHIDASKEDREEVVRFAESCLDQHYGYLTIFSLFFSLLTGARFNFGFEGQEICSGLVARALERTRAIFDRTPSHIMPADLAKYFEVEPDRTQSKGVLPPRRG